MLEIAWSAWLARAETLVETHGWILWSLGALSVVTLLLSVLLIPLLIVRLPEDYYTRRPRGWAARHPGRPAWLHWTAVCLRNVAGVALVLAGVAMLFLPGQGILTMMAGLALVDFPYKRALELRLLRTRGVFRLVAWLRERAGAPPLRLS